jgi:hypothetical protein
MQAGSSFAENGAERGRPELRIKINNKNDTPRFATEEEIEL